MKKPFFLLLLEMASSHANRSRVEFQKLDLTDGQPKILYILAKQDGYTQKELAELCKVRQSTLTVMLDKMEKKNYIYKEKVTVSGGKRAYQIYLTQLGREMGERVIALTDELDKQSLKGFSEKEEAVFYEMIRRVVDNLEG